MFFETEYITYNAVVFTYTKHKQNISIKIFTFFYSLSRLVVVVHLCGFSCTYSNSHCSQKTQNKKRWESLLMKFYKQRSFDKPGFWLLKLQLTLSLVISGMKTQKKNVSLKFNNFIYKNTVLYDILYSWNIMTVLQCKRF